MTADKNYRWEKQNGAINLLPLASEPPLLQTHVGHFSIKTSSSLEALNLLMRRAEVKDMMSNLRLKRGLTIIKYLSNSTEFSLEFKGGSLRQALNAIAVAKGTDVWDYREIHCGNRRELIVRF